MGSYNVICGLSGESISYGRKCIIIPITTQLDKERAPIGKDVIFTDTFLPKLLPIIGVYNDYGSIDWEENFNSQFNESVTKMSTDELLDSLSGNGKDSPFSAFFALEKYAKRAYLMFRKNPHFFPSFSGVLNATDYHIFIELLVRFNSISMAKDHAPFSGFFMWGSTMEKYGYEYPDEMIKSKKFWGELMKLACLHHTLMSMGKTWFPTTYGYQFNNRNFMKEFLS